MSDKADLSLDEVVSSSRRGRGAGRGGARGRGRGRGRGGLTFAGSTWSPAEGQKLSFRLARDRAAPYQPYQSAKASRGTLDSRWAAKPYKEKKYADDEPEEYEDEAEYDEEYPEAEPVAEPVVAKSSASKLLVSGLFHEVSDADIKELFGKFSGLVLSHVNFNSSGRSMGTATIIYNNYNSALKAFNAYNNVTLDGQPMHIEFVGAEVAPSTIPVARTQFRITNDIAHDEEELEEDEEYQYQERPHRGRGLARGRGHSRGRGEARGRGRGRGSYGNSNRSKTSADLDAELEKYNPKSTSDLDAELDRYNSA